MPIAEVVALIIMMNVVNNWTEALFYLWNWPLTRQFNQLVSRRALKGQLGRRNTFVCILADSGFFENSLYQGGVKSTVSWVFEDLKFNISEGYKQN